LNSLGFALGVIALLVVGIVAHELGHLMGGKLSGHRLVWFQVGPLIWMSQDGRSALGRSDALKGLALGQCMMAPPSRFEDFRFKLLNAGGGLANVGLVVICLVPYLLLDLREPVSAFLEGGIFINAIFAALNLVPMAPNGVPNDGMNLLVASRSDESRRAFWLLLRAYEKISLGLRPRDFSEEDLALAPDADVSNYYVASIRMLEADRLRDLGNADEAAAIYEAMPIERMPGIYRMMVQVELLYHYSAEAPDAERANAIYASKDVGRFLKTVRQPGVMSALAAYQMFVQNDRAAGTVTIGKAKAANARSRFRGIAECEAERLAYLERKAAC